MRAGLCAILALVVLAACVAPPPPPAPKTERPPGELPDAYRHPPK